MVPFIHHLWQQSLCNHLVTSSSHKFIYGHRWRQRVQGDKRTEGGVVRIIVTDKCDANDTFDLKFQINYLDDRNAMLSQRLARGKAEVRNFFRPPSLLLAYLAFSMAP